VEGSRRDQPTIKPTKGEDLRFVQVNAPLSVKPFLCVAGICELCFVTFSVVWRVCLR
jgi:hypothetical protein